MRKNNAENLFVFLLFSLKFSIHQEASVVTLKQDQAGVFFSSNGPYPIHLTKHFSSLPHPSGLEQLKQIFPKLFQEIICSYSFLGNSLPSFGAQKCCQFWGLDALTCLILQQKPVYCVFLWTSVTATVFQVGSLMSFLTISIWTCLKV